MQFNSLALDRDGNLITAAEYVRPNLALEHRHIWKAVDAQQAANPSKTNPPSLTPTPLTEPLKNSTTQFPPNDTTFVGDLHVLEKRVPAVYVWMIPGCGKKRGQACF